MLVSFALVGEYINQDGEEMLFHTAPTRQSWLVTSTLVGWFNRSCGRYIDRYAEWDGKNATN